MEIDVKWDAEAVNQLKKLERKVASRIVSKIDNIKLNPERYIFSLVSFNYSKVRVGDYRIFVNFTNNVLKVRTIKHRKKAYKK